jgi:Tol biopolymer transport system component
MGNLAVTALAALMLVGCCACTINSAPSSTQGAAFAAQTGESPTRSEVARFDQPLGKDEIVFNSDLPGNYELFAMRTDGSALRQLTQDSTYNSWWGRVSPGRDQLLFYRTPTSAKGHYDSEPGESSLWMLKADGSEPREIRRKAADGWEVQGHAEWSPDGTQLVMLGGKRINPQIFITDSSGVMVRSVTKDRPGSNVDPSWSPNGRTIAFVGCPRAICFEKDLEIYTIAPDGTREKRLTDNGVRDQDPYFSPDGKQIAWIAETEPNAFAPGIGVWNIFLMAADGSNQHNLTNDRQINSKPAWSLDGRRVYFHRLQPGKSSRWSIFAINPDGTGLTEITRGLAANAEFPSN